MVLKRESKLGLVVYDCYLNMWETEAGGLLWFQRYMMKS